MLDLEQGGLNFKAAGNSNRFCRWIHSAFERPCTWLPNLYFLESRIPKLRRPWNGSTLRIGAYGAVRPLKNHLSAAAAALQLKHELHVALEFHISVGRVEGGSTVVRSIRAMMNDLPGVTLIEDEWWQWPRFRQVVRHMDLIMQPSFTETFNMVTADAASEGIPAVVSDAIDWAPADWKAEVDDAVDIAKTAKYLLHHQHAGAEGFAALHKHNDDGLRAWHAYLDGTRP
jgi:hypothetical protein